MDQANLLLFPIEIARIVSILIQGTDHGGKKDASLKQVRYFLDKQASKYQNMTHMYNLMNCF